jgi:hypothetical protein
MVEDDLILQFRPVIANSMSQEASFTKFLQTQVNLTSRSEDPMTYRDSHDCGKV